MRPKRIDRDVEIFKSLISGKNFCETAREHSLTRVRTSQILFQVRRKILRLEKLANDSRQYLYSGTAKKTLLIMREKQDFWLLKADELKEHYKTE